MNRKEVFIVKGTWCDCCSGEECSCIDWDVAVYENKELAQNHAELAIKKSQEISAAYCEMRDQLQKQNKKITSDQIDDLFTEEQRESVFDGEHVSRWWRPAAYYYVESIRFYEQAQIEKRRNEAA